MSKKEIKDLINYINLFKKEWGYPFDSCWLYLNRGPLSDSTLNDNHSPSRSHSHIGESLHPVVIGLEKAINDGRVTFEEVKNVHNLMIPLYPHGLMFLAAILNNDRALIHKIDNDPKLYELIPVYYAHMVKRLGHNDRKIAEKNWFSLDTIVKRSNGQKS